MRPGQGVSGGVSNSLWGHLIAPSRGGNRGGADLPAHLEVAFRWRRRRLVELDGDVAGDLRGAAAPLGWRPGGLWVEVLAAVVAALRQAGAVDGGVGAEHLLLCVSFHEQIDGQHTGSLWAERTRKTKVR